jgi:multicomponent Na+:H+ antiporter subunit E
MNQRILAFLKYCLIFMRELWNANIAVVKLVLSRELKIKPGFISVPMTVRSDFEVTSYANSVTLTPGTISVHIPDDRHALVIHAIDIGSDPEAVRASCINALEIPLLRWARGNTAPSTVTSAPSPTVAAPPPKSTAPDSDVNAGDSI